MQVEVLNEYFKVDGEEVKNPDKFGKSIVVNGEEYREGCDMQVTTPEGTIYEGTLVGCTKKKIKVEDNEYVVHEFEVEKLEDMQLVVEEDDEE